MEQYKAYHKSSLHIARITKRNKIVAEARNTIGSRSRGCGWNDRMLHAEVAAIKQLGDTSKLKGCVLEVVRISTQGYYLNSKPCKNCTYLLEKCMKEYGLLKVYYSEPDDSILRTTSSEKAQVPRLVR